MSFTAGIWSGLASRPQASNCLRSSVERQSDREHWAESVPTLVKIEFSIARRRAEKSNESD